MYYFKDIDMRQQNRNVGFTLIELSIVLIVIGLVIGGVLVGRDLIKASELRKVISEVDGIKLAINNFRLKYNALPGDMTDAETYWGSNSSCPNPPKDNIAKTATCNGNGNGAIGKYSSLATPPNEVIEWFTAVQQLSNAGFIKGQYSGAGGTNGDQGRHVEALPGINVPTSIISGAGYQISNLSGAIALNPGVFFAGNYDNVIYFGKPFATHELQEPVLTPEQAYSIDLKIDDGKPGKGAIRTYEPAYKPNCANTNVSSTATYILNVTSITCQLFIDIR